MLIVLDTTGTTYLVYVNEIEKRKKTKKNESEKKLIERSRVYVYIHLLWLAKGCLSRRHSAAGVRFYAVGVTPTAATTTAATWRHADTLFRLPKLFRVP